MGLLGQVEAETASQPERESEEPLRRCAGERMVALAERFWRVQERGGRSWKGGLRPKWVLKQEFSLRLDK